jgi:predicted TIM-barrel fold metal-dependent hydrolase
MSTAAVASLTESVFSATRAPDEDWLARALAEPVIEPELPIIDPHVHFWHHKTGYRYFLEEFARDVVACGHNIEATVFVECSAMYRASGPDHLKPVGETEFALGQAAMAASGKYTSCRAAAGIVGFVDLTLGQRTQEALDAQIAAANGHFRGVRQRAKWDPDLAVRGPVSVDQPGLYLKPEFGRGIDLLTQRGLAFDASIFHPQLPDVTTLARAHPEASIVLIHCGSPVTHSSYAGRKSQVHAQWLADMKDLARCPNVAVKMGGLLMCLGSFDFTRAERPPTSTELASLWQPWIEPCIEVFGADRCMVSSNFPVDKAGMTYGAVWNAYKRITAGCSAEEKNKLFSGTARRVYQL